MLLERCPWYVAGPLLGLLIVAFRAAINRPFGALGGYIELVERGARIGRWSSSVFVLVGIIVGGAAFTLASGSQQPAWSYAAAVPFLPGTPLLQFAVLLAAGGLMGFGAKTAGGCTSGHGLTGMSLASPASLAATATFFATAVALAHALAWLTGAQ